MYYLFPNRHIILCLNSLQQAYCFCVTDNMIDEISVVPIDLQDVLALTYTWLSSDSTTFPFPFLEKQSIIKWNIKAYQCFSNSLL